MGALSTYLFRVRRLLHDATGREYPDTDLTDYINQSRQDVCKRTGCLRTLQTSLTITGGVESYNIQSFLAPNTVDVMGITVYWGSMRQKLGYLAFTEFDSRIRVYQNIQQTPYVFSRYGATTIYIGPKPDQNYVSDWDTVMVANDLIDDTTVEQIPIPFQTAVQFYAAHRAKQYEQSTDEAALFLSQYKAELAVAVGSFMRRTIRNPYADPQMS